MQSDYPERVYALNPPVTGFGAEEMPVIVAAGKKARNQPDAGNVLSAHGGSPSAAVLQYTDQEGIAVITFPTGRYIEEAHYAQSFDVQYAKLLVLLGSWNEAISPGVILGDNANRVQA